PRCSASPCALNHLNLTGDKVSQGTVSANYEPSLDRGGFYRRFPNELPITCSRRGSGSTFSDLHRERCGAVRLCGTGRRLRCPWSGSSLRDARGADEWSSRLRSAGAWIWKNSLVCRTRLRQWIRFSRIRNGQLRIRIRIRPSLRIRTFRICRAYLRLRIRTTPDTDQPCQSGAPIVDRAQLMRLCYQRGRGWPYGVVALAGTVTKGGSTTI